MLKRHINLAETEGDQPESPKKIRYFLRRKRRISEIDPKLEILWKIDHLLPISGQLLTEIYNRFLFIFNAVVCSIYKVNRDQDLIVRRRV